MCSLHWLLSSTIRDENEVVSKRPGSQPAAAAGQNNGRRARLLDVAREARVSRATAARALGGYGPVGAETERRVMAAAKRLGYRTNELARAMRAGKTLTIGLVVADIRNSFFDRVTHAIIGTAAQLGYQVLVTNTDEELSAEVEAVRVLTEKRVDGLIVVPSSPTQYGHLLINGSFVTPLVLLDRRIAALHVGSVTTDDHGGALEAVRLFTSRGHERIGLLVSSTTVEGQSQTDPANAISTISDRVGGFIAGLAEAGIAVNANWVRYSRADHALATRTARQMLAGQPHPTALLTTNSDMALAVIDACRALGHRLGDDVSLISFDDSPWAPVFSPAVTVIARPVDELGRAAVLQLVSQIESGSVRAESIVLPTVLISRESVADLRKRPRAASQVASQAASPVEGAGRSRP